MAEALEKISCRPDIIGIALLQSAEPAYEYQADFILVGILKSNYVGYSSGTITGIAGEGSAITLLPEQYQVYSTDFRTNKKQGFQQTVYDLVDELGIDEKQIQYNWLYLNALGISYEQEGKIQAKIAAFPMLYSAAITLGFAFIAAIPAARNAARVSPTVAMRGITGKIKRKRRKDKPIRHFEAFYARLNLKRNAGRTAITTLSLVMSISVYVALQSFSGLLDAAQDVRMMYLGDYSLTNDGIGFDSSVVGYLRKQEGISSVSTLKYSLYRQDQDGHLPIAIGFSLKPGETLHIVGVDEERLKTLAPTLTNEDLQALKNGEACLIAKVMDNEGFVNGIQVVVFDTVYDKLTGKTTYEAISTISGGCGHGSGRNRRLRESPMKRRAAAGSLTRMSISSWKKALSRLSCWRGD
ncbi:hypothetical protein ACF3MZ_18830 [Paenibacillaceae bacterium WGS1546]|uniref:hypothetical protein n=1 Tax=Cohnella sp. WGS1546 TaxID=3366810 RepID=UPI00372D17CE